MELVVPFGNPTDLRGLSGPAFILARVREVDEIEPPAKIADWLARARPRPRSPRCGCLETAGQGAQGLKP